MAGNTLSSARATETNDFWRRRFASPVPETSLPLDHPRPPRGEGAVSRAQRTAVLTVTADMVTQLTAFVALLHRYGGTAATETAVAHEGLPLRVTIDGDTPFTELRDQITAVRAEAAAHHLPTTDLLRLLAPEPFRGGGLLCATGFGPTPGTRPAHWTWPSR